MALCSDGTAAAWGRNFDGELGDNASESTRLVPVTVNGSALRPGERFGKLFTSGGSPFYSLAVAYGPPVAAVNMPMSSSITLTSAALGGNVTSEGGTAITERGVVYAVTSTNNNPQIGGAGVISLSTTGTTGAFTVSSTPLTPGTTYSFAAYATNSVGTGYSSVGTFTTLNLLESWRQQHFGLTSNTGTAADTFDFDGDGLSNLLEWALGLDPKQASLQPVTMVREGDFIEFTYHRSAAGLSAGAVFTAEWSDTMLSGSWSREGVTEEILADNGTVQEVKAVLPAGGSGRFVHLKVTGPP